MDLQYGVIPRYGMVGVLHFLGLTFLTIQWLSCSSEELPELVSSTTTGVFIVRLTHRNAGPVARTNFFGVMFRVRY